MRLVDRYPIIVTDRLGACRDFYAGRLGFEVAYPLTDEPFRQRRSGFHDPAGVWIDVVEQIDPAPGFWERYPAGVGRAER